MVFFYNRGTMQHRGQREIMPCGKDGLKGPALSITSQHACRTSHVNVPSRLAARRETCDCFRGPIIICVPVFFSREKNNACARFGSTCVPLNGFVKVKLCSGCSSALRAKHHRLILLASIIRANPPCFIFPTRTIYRPNFFKKKIYCPTNGYNCWAACWYLLIKSSWNEIRKGKGKESGYIYF